ncbi:phage tail protein [Lichenicola cladoniae]|uniref:Phage tail protein n=1 Tax=Lichenicola cladoniae TaxID=1484109 RepID=A0A6M8HQF4_9PROT|nr:phage tail protein [Lichenicola cladoniae]NPD67860.1 phage tail protein [Acetobacteraceae bacterium]QKE90461.1 phage tail protein [Lichenicola cladoniae]
MAQITQVGALNTAALVVPDLYVQIASPQTLALNGVPTDRIGIVGTASWGPVNQPVVLGSLADYGAAFGPVLARPYDLGTPIACAQQQGAASFVGVRVTDGTDVAASYALDFTGSVYPMLLTALCTGSRGNQISIAFGAGSEPATWKLTLQMPGSLAEVFDNIGMPGDTLAFWSALVAAVNNGTGATRGPSNLCIGSIGPGSSIPPAAISNQLLLNGTDGTNGVVPATLVGVDGLPRSGMYVLRGRGCALGMLSDCDDPTQWTVQSAFGQSEGIYMILVGTSGDNIANAIQAKQLSGLDSYTTKLMFGDWLFWYDQANAQTRIVSPQGFTAGCLSNQSPEQSSLNKRLAGIVGSQKSGLASSGQALTYSSAELQALFTAGIDVICNPVPGGAYWAVRCGHNSSSNAIIASDSYTRMTNFLAETLAAGMGGYVGAIINSTLLSNIRATLLGTLSNLLGQGILGSLDGSLPYAVACGAGNNPQSRTALGYVQADVQVRYQGINEKFIVNLQGGQSVTVTQAGGGG